jgi:AsmA protein
MRRKTIMPRLRKLGLATFACLLFVVLAPMFFAERRSDEPFAISSVIASPRDLHVLSAPVRLSEAPDLALTRAIVYDYGSATPGGAPSRILLEGPVFTLNAAGPRPAPRTGNGDLDAASLGSLAPLVQQMVSLGFEVISIRRGTLNVTMADGTVETIGDIQAEVTRRPKGQIESQGSFTVRGQRLAFVATLGQPSDKQQQRWALQASFKGNLIQGSFEGHVGFVEDLHLAGEVDLSMPSLRRVGKWFGLPLHTTEGFNATTIKGELTWARRSLAFEKARVAVDGNEGNGRLMLNLAGERPHIDASLDFSQLNLTPYVEAARLQFFGFDLPGASWSSFDISLPMIRYLDADLRVSARKVTLKGYALGQAGATITAQAGKLQADITELELNSGTLSAQVTAIMSEDVPRYALRAKLENVEAGPASTLLLGASALAGRATLSVDLTSSGYSLYEVVRRLSGKAAMAMPEGGRLALDAKALRAAAKTGARGWAGLAKAQMSIDKLEARALIIGGVAFAEEMYARAGALALAATGRLGLDDGNMDVRLALKGDVPPDQPIKLSDLAGGETVTLRGPWNDPLVRGDDGDAGSPPR